MDFRRRIAYVCLAAMTVAIQVHGLGWRYLETFQWERHLAVVNGTTGDPWQYRVLTEQVMRPFIAVADLLGVPSHAAVTFVLFRVCQEIAIFALAHAVYRKLGHSSGAAMLGVGFIAVAVTSAVADSDLSFNTYSDIIFYLAAAWLLLDRRIWAVVALMPFAVANRDTAMMIPVLVLVFCGWKAWRPTAAAAAAGAATMIVIRTAYGPRPFMAPWGKEPGIDVLELNMRAVVFIQLGLTLGVVAVLAFLAWPNAGRLERRLTVALAAPWVLLHALIASVYETRLLLVPVVVAVVPMALTLTRQTSCVAGREVVDPAGDQVVDGERGSEPGRTEVPAGTVHVQE